MFWGPGGKGGPNSGSPKRSAKALKPTASLTHLADFDHLLHRIRNHVGVILETVNVDRKELRFSPRHSKSPPLCSPLLTPCLLPQTSMTFSRYPLQMPQHVGSGEQHGCGVGDVPAHCLGKRVPGSLWTEGRLESLGADIMQSLRSGRGIREERTGQGH